MNNYNTLKILPTQGLEPRQFLRYCFGIATLGAESLLEEETDSQYRKKCITVLSHVFNIEKATVRKWGTDLNFDGMPNYCKIGLAYIQSAQINSKIVETILNGEYVPPIIEPQIFLEKILLDGLSEQQRVQTISHTGFHASCIRTLTQVLHVGARSVQKWGQDITFSKMPRIHKHTLGYALAAISKSQHQSNNWNQRAA
ncbi:hypothetical protein DSM106972_066950 [Dulcicalothrix desertica PCC 7102]|uniref:Uncharacterized protein n=1 Tax=Dulcicalothrix desertica PCC 7102 TaxID=232991 RepID=A0A433V678_9CYAN|nr:hypothetical protein [Dulcicalothrix desertica]RUT01598.1 hypothetical protein DSM106972_066950 [Dulcicalothrix desertica PCC 7102]